MWLKNERCGKYELFEKLASGGMADIFLGRTLLADGICKFVAVKRIQSRFSNSQQFQNMFREEAKVAINLKNNNIVSTLDFGFENEQYYLVMDFVEGVTLKQLSTEMKRENKTFSFDQVLYLVKQVAAGLDYAHHATETKTGKNLNLIHRDMSPHNVMVSFGGDVKIIDFGIAKVDDPEQSRSETGSLRGKCRYMSPEQVECEELDGRSDIFSLGIILWELLANNKLFNDKSESKILQKVKACEIPPIRRLNPSVPVELALIISKALSKDRDQRYQKAADLSYDLNTLLQKNYPHFSKKVFGNFIKELFEIQFTELAAKLSNIASIPYESPKKLIVLDDLTRVPASAPPLPIQANHELPDGLGSAPPVATAVAPNINFEKLLETNLVPDSVKALNTEKNIFAQKVQRNFGQKIKPPEPVKLKAASVVNGVMDSLLKYAILALVLSICYFAFTKNAAPAIRNYLTSLSGVHDKKIGTSDASSEAAKNSLPEAAPAPNTDLLTISKAMKLGYLNITLVKENPKVEILINGKLLLEKPPLYMYPITAGKEITISAFDPITKKSAEVKLVVAEGKTANVPLSFVGTKK